VPGFTHKRSNWCQRLRRGDSLEVWGPNPAACAGRWVGAVLRVSTGNGKAVPLPIGKSNGVLSVLLRTCDPVWPSCLALERLAATLVKTLEPIGSEPAAAEVRNLWSKARDD